MKNNEEFLKNGENLFILIQYLNHNSNPLGRVLGYEPIDIGPLKAARHLEALTLFQIYLGDVLNSWEFTLKLLTRES